MENECVSIIMPSHNDREFLKQSIGSVLSQTYQNFELLIVDDASTDGSCAWIKREFRDERIRLFENKVNQGAAFSRNLALKNARGRWIAFLDADDFWYPEKLAKQIGFMKKYNYSFTYTQYFEAGEDLEPKYIISGPRRITKRKMRMCGYMGCLTVMYNSQVIGTLQISDDIQKRNDYALWILASERADAFLLREPLAIYRKRPGSVSSVSTYQKLRWEKEVFRRYVSRTDFGASARAILVGFNTLVKKTIYKKRIK